MKIEITKINIPDLFVEREKQLVQFHYNEIKDAQSFKKKFIALIENNGFRKTAGLVYLIRSQAPIPRLRDSSDIVYIGKTRKTFFSRYKPIIDVEVDDYFDRYLHLIKNHQGIYIELLETNLPDDLEDIFIFQYFQKHLELPPLNLKSFNKKIVAEYGLLPKKN